MRLEFKIRGIGDSCLTSEVEGHADELVNYVTWCLTTFGKLDGIHQQERKIESKKWNEEQKGKV